MARQSTTRDYELSLEPETGGEVEVAVSGWAGWNVWLTVAGYYDGKRADVAVQPREALRVAARLTVAAVRVWLIRQRETQRR